MYCFKCGFRPCLFPFIFLFPLFRCFLASLWEGLSIHLSVCWSVGPLRKCKKRVSWLFLAAVRSYTETNDQPTCFKSFHPSVRPSVSPYIRNMINTRWDTARTHLCPVGLVAFIFHSEISHFISIWRISLVSLSNVTFFRSYLDETFFFLFILWKSHFHFLMTTLLNYFIDIR